MKQNSVWVVDDDSSIRFVLQRALEQSGFLVKAFEDAESLLDALVDEQPDVLVSDISMPKMDGLEMLKEIKYDYVSLPVIIMTAHSDIANAVESFEKGAFEYLPKPFDLDEAISLVKRAISAQEQAEAIAEAPSEIETAGSQYEIIGNAASMQEVFRLIGRLSKTSINVLVRGESGTGKELVAHAIHNHSPRRENSFIALNMAAIPKDLIESELFGHEKGAFTGANTKRTGRFEQANGGTLFLDEIGDMPMDAQTRLLRVLQEKEFYRVGGHDSIEVDVRIIAATHQNLEKLVSEGKFREDLYHRLHVISIKIPPLRERKEDIPLLIERFINLASIEHAVPVKRLHPELKEMLISYSWPGNVRQLYNICQWLLLMSVGTEILPTDLPTDITKELADSKPDVESTVAFEEGAAIKTASVDDKTELTYQSWQEYLKHHIANQLEAGETEVLHVNLAEFEKVHIQVALDLTHGRKSEAAQLLGWGRNTLTRKLNDLDLNKSWH